MKVKFITLNQEIEPVMFTVEAPTPIQVLAAIEQELKKRGCEENLSDDVEFDATDCIRSLSDGEEYVRNSMGDPWSDFRLEPIAE